MNATSMPTTAGQAQASTIALSLVSHTNVGKTTLARTLLGRDIGEVRDQAHVTLEAADHVVMQTPEGDRLVLWDTPGFGDSHRLARRLEQAGNPIGWFLSEVWDRFRDRAFWSSQRAVRHLVGDADVVLYLLLPMYADQFGVTLAEAGDRPVRALLAAHGIPETLVTRKGDPYQEQIESTCARVAERAGLGPRGERWDICYQSRVGPLKWLGPATPDAIQKAGEDGLGVVLTPIAFVSEHIETLVELDIEYGELTLRPWSSWTL
eukprot:gene57059-76190_t